MGRHTQHGAEVGPTIQFVLVFIPYSSCSPSALPKLGAPRLSKQVPCKKTQACQLHRADRVHIAGHGITRFGVNYFLFLVMPCAPGPFFPKVGSV